MSRYECEDCGLSAMDLPDGFDDPEFYFDRDDDGVMRCPACHALAAGAQMSDEILALRLAAASGCLRSDWSRQGKQWCTTHGGDWPLCKAAALLPAVHAYGDERAAEALDSVAEELLGFGDTAPSQANVHLAAWLQATADNLRKPS